VAEVGNDCPHEYGEADQGGGEQQLRQDHHGSGLEPASLDHLPVQEEHLLPKTQGRGKYTNHSHTQHKTYGKKSGGEGGGNRQHRAESWAQLRPVCLVCIVHQAGSARLYAGVYFQLLRWNISARL
jgi:hypothetical protein